jgi:hypothetical protein
VQPNELPFWPVNYTGFIDGFHAIEIGQNKNTYCPI